MNRWITMLCALAMLMCCLTGCASRAGATVRDKGDSANYDDYDTDPEDMPRLPEDLSVNDEGVPQLKVYDAASESVKEMDMEEYLCGVLAGEMKNDWPMEALKAQAILARTYALKFVSTKDSKYDGADISTDVSEAQAYNAEAINDRIRDAVNQTRGVVMTDNGELVNAWFHAHSGGMTEVPSIALDYKDGDPAYLKPVKVRESDNAPEDVKSWTASFTKQQIEQACADAGVTVGDVTSVEIGKKGASGRAAELIVNGKAVSAPTLRLALDASLLKSTLISDIAISGDTVTFTGSGFGHGVGMSQWGAYALAEKGEDADDIIDTFFDDVDIVKMWK